MIDDFEDPDCVEEYVRYGTFYSPDEVVEDVRARLGITPEHTVLDLGCGAGWSTDLVLLCDPKEVIAVDYSQAMLDAARRRIDDSRVRFMQGDIQDLPITGDRAIAWDVLFHLDDIPGFLDSLYDALTPGGKFLFTWDTFKGEQLQNVYFNRVVANLALRKGRSYRYDECVTYGLAKEELERMIGGSGFSIDCCIDEPSFAQPEHVRELHGEWWGEAEKIIAPWFRPREVLWIKKKTFKAVNKYAKKGKDMGVYPLYVLAK